MTEKYMTVERWRDPAVRAKSGIIDLWAFVEKTQRQAEYLKEMERADEVWAGSRKWEPKEPW